ncbi:UNKNOWN [Stylonychia lemnae]|uniref:Cadg domain containing protein n=1 Tax=Stylonychia lemnae TaxID=5949 RepID=A0A078B1H5_STYLE|nr:UNKNOWN [Stylonychia lemnae]|eukprot:CDW88161.1 UNKNOWN [Stylonychia lemnae]
MNAVEEVTIVMIAKSTGDFLSLSTIFAGLVDRQSHQIVVDDQNNVYSSYANIDNELFGYLTNLQDERWMYLINFDAAFDFKVNFAKGIYISGVNVFYPMDVDASFDKSSNQSTVYIFAQTLKGIEIEFVAMSRGGNKLKAAVFDSFTNSYIVVNVKTINNGSSAFKSYSKYVGALMSYYQGQSCLKLNYGEQIKAFSRAQLTFQDISTSEFEVYTQNGDSLITSLENITQNLNDWCTNYLISIVETGNFTIEYNLYTGPQYYDIQNFSTNPLCIDANFTQQYQVVHMLNETNSDGNQFCETVIYLIDSTTQSSFDSSIFSYNNSTAPYTIYSNTNTASQSTFKSLTLLAYYKDGDPSAAIASLILKVNLYDCLTSIFLPLNYSNTIYKLLEPKQDIALGTWTKYYSYYECGEYQLTPKLLNQTTNSVMSLPIIFTHDITNNQLSISTNDVTKEGTYMIRIFGQLLSYPSVQNHSDFEVDVRCIVKDLTYQDIPTQFYRFISFDQSQRKFSIYTDNGYFANKYIIRINALVLAPLIYSYIYFEDQDFSLYVISQKYSIANEGPPYFDEQLKFIYMVVNQEFLYTLPNIIEPDNEKYTIRLDLGQTGLFTKFINPNLKFDPTFKNNGTYMIQITLEDSNINKKSTKYFLNVVVLSEEQASNGSYGFLNNKLKVIKSGFSPILIPIIKTIDQTGGMIQSRQSFYKMGYFQKRIQICPFPMSIVWSASLQYLWGMINVLQIIAHLPLYNINFPDNAKLLYSLIISISQFDILPTTYFDQFFQFSDEQPINDRFSDMDIFQCLTYYI